jgi:membrane protease YdiL (CAAX protease family)
MQYFLSFIKDPTYNEKIKKFNVRIFLSLLFIYFAAIIPIGSILFFIFKTFNIDHKAIDLSFQEKILHGILLAPIVEELLFRLILVFNKKNLTILIFTTFIMLGFFIIKENILKMAIFFLLILTFVFIYKYINQCRSYFIMYYKLFFFLIAGLFAFLHFFNFIGISVSNLIFLPILVIPQFILGLLLGYIRISYGLIYSIFFHMLINCFVLV